MKQNERIKWLKIGDSNTAYFHVCVRNKQTKNHIGSLINSARQIIQNTEDVEEEILRFYKILLGTAASTLLVIDPDVMQKGNVLSRHQQLQLIKPVTKEEVQIALKGIDGGKAPGCDG